MGAYETCSEALVKLSSTRLKFRPKTDEVVKDGLILAGSFEKLDGPDRSRILEAITPDLGGRLLALSGLMAEGAVNAGDAAYIRGATVLHLIENSRTDYRENIRHLVLIAYAANSLGVDFRSIVESILPLASERAGKLLRDFAGRDNSLNRLESFGIRVEQKEGRFRFVLADR